MESIDKYEELERRIGRLEHIVKAQHKKIRMLEGKETKLKYSSLVSLTKSNNIMKNNKYYPAYKGNSIHIDKVLRVIGSRSGFGFRMKLAEVNGIKNYRGTTSQNCCLIELAKAGRLKKVSK